MRGGGQRCRSAPSTSSVKIDDELRAQRPDSGRFGVQPVRSAIRRADEAVAGCFRRVKAGEKPRYPRCTSHRRLRTAFYDEPVSWALRRVGAAETRPALYLQGVGEIELSRSALSQLRRLIDRGGDPAPSPSPRPPQGRGGPASGSVTCEHEGSSHPSTSAPWTGASPSPPRWPTPACS
jgi:hypothetical protein